MGSLHPEGPSGLRPDRRLRAMVFDGTPGRLRPAEVEPPDCNAGEMLVDVLGCTLCGSDLHSFEGRRRVPVPTVLGHEIVGRIRRIGPVPPSIDAPPPSRPVFPIAADGSPLAVGDRVAWAIVASCGGCDRCRRGMPQKCARGFKYGHEPVSSGGLLSGGLAEACRLVAGTAVVRLPDNVPLEAACPAGCATATIAAALEPAGDLTGATVAVFGLGLLGLTACAMAREAGAQRVIGIDPRPARRDRAGSFGATAVAEPGRLQDLLGGDGVDCALEVSGTSAAVAEAIQAAAIGGRIQLVGSVLPTAAVALDPERVVRRLLEIRGFHNYAPRHLARAVRFLADCGRRYPLEGLVERWFPLADAEAAFAHAARSDAVRIGVRPD
jgi:putative phosphonate catabolism associated alcohol dehydrogenase